MRPGNTAEAITPIIVARMTGAQRIGASGSAARSIACQEIERNSSENAISTSANTIQPGVAVISAWPMRDRPKRDSANTTSAATAIAAARMPTRAQTLRRRRGGGFSGVSIARGLSERAALAGEAAIARRATASPRPSGGGARRASTVEEGRCERELRAESMNVER